MSRFTYCLLLLVGVIFSCNQCTVDPRNIKTLHVVFMTHFDIGYTNFIHEVINYWFDTVIPDAIDVAEHFRKKGGPDQYIYTAHSWLFSLYLKCPPGMKFHCPTTEQVKRFNDSVKAGQLTWHAYPFNAIPELMDESLFQFGIQLSHEMDDWYGFPHKKTMSQRDEPQATRSIVPWLVKNKVLAFSEGSNPEPPDMGVPNVFLWRVAEEGVEYEIIAMQHSGGYGGLDVKDAMMVEGFDQALIFAFRIDNRGSFNVTRVEEIFAQLRKEFPNANVKASTFDAFVEELEKARPHLNIPVVTEETGDTWMNGPPSDPWKMAAFREISRARAKCLAEKRCRSDDFAMYNMSRMLLKCAEHTWGKPGVPNNNWSNEQFKKVRNTPPFVAMKESWAEQRAFINHSIDALPKGHELRKDLEKALDSIIARRPNLHGSKPVNIENSPSLQCGSTDISFRFDEFGRLVQLTDELTHMEWADVNHPMATVLYSTYDEAYLKPCWKHYGSLCWKPNISEAHPTRADWSLLAKEMWWKNITVKRPDAHNSTNEVKHAACEVNLRLAPVSLLTTKYGAPPEFWLTAVFFRDANKHIKFDFIVQWFDKPATRLPEAIWMWLNPRVDYANGWSMTKLGHPVSPYHVANNGSQHLHGVEAVTYESDTGKLTAVNLDGPVVSPSFSKEVPFQPMPAPGMTPYNEIWQGMNFLLFQNIYTTNFILWYPYEERPGKRDDNSKYRWEMVLES
eukprot:TRINITY_DN64293_c0_g1_i2.p1 TRINITY_DN64293_c0_g1~~TRINITY_DN64293_c0_g1_i2.p1  ORF type:complete len:745 (-),score=30.95 TRINITY_DN64293_c0_g1_i2:1443-3641(-)